MEIFSTKCDELFFKYKNVSFLASCNALAVNSSPLRGSYLIADEQKLPTYDSVDTSNFECALTFAYETIVATDTSVFAQPEPCTGIPVSISADVNSFCKFAGAARGSFMLATEPLLRSTIFDSTLVVSPFFLAACSRPQRVTTATVPLSMTMRPVTTTLTPRAVEGGIFPLKVNNCS